MIDELTYRAIKNMNELARQMGPMIDAATQRAIRAFNHIATELGLIRHRYKYHTKRVAVRKMQLRRLRHEQSY